MEMKETVFVKLKNYLNQEIKTVIKAERYLVSEYLVKIGYVDLMPKFSDAYEGYKIHPGEISDAYTNLRNFRLFETLQDANRYAEQFRSYKLGYLVKGPIIFKVKIKSEITVSKEIFKIIDPHFFFWQREEVSCIPYIKAERENVQAVLWAKVGGHTFVKKSMTGFDLMDSNNCLSKT